VDLEGMVIPTRAGACLEVAGECHPVEGGLPVGRKVRVRGRRVRRTIIPSEVGVLAPDPVGTRERLSRFRAGVSPESHPSR